MLVLVRTIFGTALKILTGVGIADLLDRFIRPRVPQYYPEPVSPGFKPLKIIWFVGAFVLAFIILKKVGQKMRITILK